MKEYCGNCKHKESCKGARTDINDDFTKAVSQTNHITYNFEQLYLD